MHGESHVGSKQTSNLYTGEVIQDPPYLFTWDPIHSVALPLPLELCGLEENQSTKLTAQFARVPLFHASAIHKNQI